MVDTLHSAVVNVEDIGFTICLKGARAVVGKACSYRKTSTGVTMITHVCTGAVFIDLADAQAAEQRLQTYIDLCVEANSYKRQGGL